MTGIPALSSGPELWIAVHNHRPEPLQLHSGQNIGVLEVVTLAESPAATSTTSSHPQKPCHPPLREHLSPLQQQQLNELFREFSDVFSREDDLGNSPLLEHAIETHGPPLRQPYASRTPQFAERRWRRYSKCYPAMSSAPQTAHGPLQW